MSPELERLLREAGRRLPEPEPAITERARRSALRAVRRRSLRRPAAVLLAAALVGAGVGIGALIAPSGTASPAPVGFGFLPQPGWFVLQSGESPSNGWPAYAMASNVPFAAEDLVRGSAAASGYPLATVEELPRNGVVVVAIFTARGKDEFHDAAFPVRALTIDPLDPDNRLQAAVNGHNVDVALYFGTPQPPAAVVAAAQRQLDRLVVRSARARPAAVRAPVGTPAVVDRTFSCPVARFATLNVWASNPWYSPSDPDLFKGYVALVSGPQAVTPLVYVRRRSRPAGGFPSRSGVFARSSAPGCRPSGRTVPLTSAGLPGPPVQWATIAKCRVSGRVLVRVRATVQSVGRWRRVSSTYSGTAGNVVEARLAVRSERTGKPVAFIQLGRDSRTSLWSAPACG